MRSRRWWGGREGPVGEGGWKEAVSGYKDGGVLHLARVKLGYAAVIMLMLRST